MDVYLVEPVPPFPEAVSASFHTFTTKQNVSSAGTIPCIPANKLRKGSKLEVSARGNFSTTGTPNINLGFWIGTRALSMTIDLALSGTIATGSGAALWPWIMEWEGLVTAVGSAGSLIGQGKLWLGTSLTAFSVTPIPVTNALRTVAIATDIERAIGVSGTWSASSASNQITVDDCRAVILN